jgi:mannose-6-phosphate isomerase-like protein (cupin superfamily)
MTTIAKLTATDTLAALGKERETYMRFLERPDFDVNMYKPDRVDGQTPHTRDEIYVIARGQGELVCQGDKTHVAEGDVLFAPAGVEHRFMNFSDDFATWVIFIGPRA